MKLYKTCSTLAVALIASIALAACNNNSNPSSSGSFLGGSFLGGSSSGGSSSGGSSSGGSSSGGSSNGGSSSGGSSSGGSSSGGSSSGGSSSGGSSSGGSSGGGSGAYLLPYFDAGDSGGAIKLVDPANPGAIPVTADSGFGVTDVESGGIVTRNIDTYSIDPGNGAQSNFQPTLVTYIKNGKLYKINLSSGVSHTPQQFSSLSTACILVNEFGDGTLDGSYLVVQSLNASGDCAQNTVPGDTLSLVKVTASTSDAGIAQNGRAIEAGIIGSSGTITGFLVKETLSGTVTLRAEDLNLTHPVDLLTLDSDIHNFVEMHEGPFISGTGQLDYFTVQADGAANPALYRFNPGTNTAPKIQDLTGQADGFGDFDSSDYYYTNGGTLDKVAHTSTTPSVLLTRTLASGESLNIDGLSPTRIVFSDHSNAEASLETLLKDGSSPVTVDSASFTAPNSTSFGATPIGERLFYTRADTTISGTSFNLSQTARQAMTDGSGVVTTASNAFWSGFAIQSTGIDKVILTQYGAGNTAHLTAYSAASGTQVTDIGTANNVDSQFGGPYEFGTSGDKGLFGYSPVGANDSDTYFFDAGTNNSLLGIGTQAGVNETPILLGGF